MYKDKKNPSFSFVKGMRGELLIAITVFTLIGCGTQKSIENKDAAATQTEQDTQQPATYHVDAHPEVISIAEGIDLLANHDLTNTVSKKYSYKVIDNYDVYRLENYKTVMYKNCRLPKKVNATSYEDTPLPQVKGTSSYITVTQNNIQIAVFNNKAYQNLLEQIKGLGFALTEQGYEDKYSNGSIDIYTYAPKKLFRIEKAL